jgi:hypothetical protein
VAVLKYHDGTGWEPVVSALQGPTGSTGPTGVAVGLPTGGATGASLIKSSSTDYATEWSSNVGGLVHINTQAFSAISSLTVEDLFSTTYDNYRFVMSITSSEGAAINMRLRVGGADLSTTVYSNQTLAADSASVSGGRTASQTSAFLIYCDTAKTSGSVDLYSPFLAATKQYHSQSARIAPINYHISALINQATSYTGATFFPSSGNMTGTISIYGYAKA